MVRDMKILQELVDSERTSFYTENFHAIDLAIKKLLKRLKDLKYIEQEHKEINGQLRERVKELEEENKQLEINQEILMKTKGCLDKDNSTDCRVLESLNYGIRAYQKTNEQLKEKIKELEEEKKNLEHNYQVAIKETIHKSKIEEKIEKYKRLGDEFYEKFLETNRTDTDIHDAGIFCDGGVKVLQELLEE